MDELSRDRVIEIRDNPKFWPEVAEVCRALLAADDALKQIAGFDVLEPIGDDYVHVVADFARAAMLPREATKDAS